MRLGIQRCAHDAPRELDRDLADLAPELLEDPVPLGPDLLLGLRDGRGGLARVPRLDLGAKLLRRLPRLLDDAARLLAGLRELLSVLGELTFGLRAGLFGTLEVALDLRAPLLQQGAHPRQHPFPHEEEQDRERERPDEQLLP